NDLARAAASDPGGDRGVGSEAKTSRDAGAGPHRLRYLSNHQASCSTVRAGDPSGIERSDFGSHGSLGLSDRPQRGLGNHMEAGWQPDRGLAGRLDRLRLRLPAFLDGLGPAEDTRELRFFPPP